MPKCPKCNKEVYFAEKVTSLGKDWHRPCLRCEKCNKTLSSGGHAEHQGKPYCNKPCYSALFGPGGFGHGGTESHKYWLHHALQVRVTLLLTVSAHAKLSFEQAANEASAREFCERSGTRNPHVLNPRRSCTEHSRTSIARGLKTRRLSSFARFAVPMDAWKPNTRHALMERKCRYIIWHSYQQSAFRLIVIKLYSI